jgi:gamma-tubulin complex component 5
LDEKFRIFDSDDLADALRERLDELEETPSRWTPEKLAFLLELSDKPATKSRIEDLEALKQDDSEPSLTWSDIIADDPLDEEGIWDNVDYGAESSDDDVGEDVESETVDEGQVPEPDVGVLDASLEAFIIPSDKTSVDQLTKNQFWTRQKPIRNGYLSQTISGDDLEHLWSVSEQQALRETLLMLTGLPTSMYVNDTITGLVSVEGKFAINHSSPTSFHHILQSFAGIGARLDLLRSWVKKTHAIALMQTFAAAIEKHLNAHNTSMASKQASYLTTDADITVSLLQLHYDVAQSVRPLIQLSDLVLKLDSSEGSRASFMYLEKLFEETCSSQMIGDDIVYRFMAELFFTCFETYQKPIREWMEEGELQNNIKSFFVNKESDRARRELDTIWDEYVLRRDELGHVHVPVFLHTAMTRILTTGKSVVFLKKLGYYEENSRSLQTRAPKLDFDSVCGDESSLAPFSELFDLAFDDWIKSKHHSASLTLRQHLYSDCGLWRTLDALDYIYFFRDGSLINALTTTIFDKIDRGREAWNDRFLLTELTQSVFSGVSCIDTDRLAIRATPGKYGDVNNRRRSVKILSSISIEYTLPWAVANVVKPRSLATYQKVSGFLIQILRAMTILNRLTFVRDDPETDVEELQVYQSLRHRLLWFTNTMYSYVTETILQHETAKMREKLANAVDVDAMIAVHEAYASKLLDQCLLSKQLAPILQAVISLLDLTILFSDAHIAQTGEKLFDTTNRSMREISFHANASVSGPPRGPRVRRKEEVVSDSESEEDSEDEEADVSYISFAEEGYGPRMQKMRTQFDRLCGFVTVGLRGISRAGGESQASWEILTERLDWKQQWGR